jgi:hypothetical protein
LISAFQYFSVSAFCFVVISAFQFFSISAFWSGSGQWVNRRVLAGGCGCEGRSQQGQRLLSEKAETLKI